MQIFQVRGEDGRPRLGVRRDGRARVLRGAHEGIGDALALFEAWELRGADPGAWVQSAEQKGALADVDWVDLLAGGEPALTVPVTAPEVWGAGVTYRRSADFREEGTGIYDRVYAAERPELFFKATASRCCGPREPIGRRGDSHFTAAEPELAVVLGASGRVLGYTVANDVSAWDIERDNPLYLPQSKVYRGCFAFGPVIATPDEIPDPYALTLRCVVRRSGREVFAGEASTGQLKRRIEEIVTYLRRSNDVPTGTVLSTGTGIIQPLAAGLEEGDEVAISCEPIGTLRNTVAIV